MEEEGKTGLRGLLAQEEDQRSRLVEILPGWPLEVKTDKNLKHFSLEFLAGKDHEMYDTRELQGSSNSKFSISLSPWKLWLLYAMVGCWFFVVV